MLNTASLQWTAVVPLGSAPKPRAGCSSAVINGVWYICGGGDGSGPRKEMLSLSLTAEALEWVIFDVDAKGPLAREGLSVLAVPGVPGGGLVAFGGYDGKYHCDLSCLRPGCAGVAVAGVMMCCCEIGAKKLFAPWGFRVLLRLARIRLYHGAFARVSATALLKP